MIGRSFRDLVYCTHSFLVGSVAGLSPLHTKFPRLFALASDKNALIRDYDSFVNGTWIWDLKLRRCCLGWEEEVINSLLALLVNFFPTADKDTIVWAGDSNCRFSVKSLCSLVENTLNKADWIVSEKVRRVVPPKIVLFVWQVLENRVAVKFNLISRGMEVEDGGRCSLCGLFVETVSHLFLLCDHAWKI